MTTQKMYLLLRIWKTDRTARPRRRGGVLTGDVDTRRGLAGGSTLMLTSTVTARVGRKHHSDLQDTTKVKENKVFELFG